MTFEEYVESERREERYEILMEIEKMKAERDAAISERDSIREEINAIEKRRSAIEEFNVCYDE